jgi:hypothetical protein
LYINPPNSDAIVAVHPLRPRISLNNGRRCIIHVMNSTFHRETSK